MKRATFLILITFILILATTACSENENASKTGNSSETIVQSATDNTEENFDNTITTINTAQLQTADEAGANSSVIQTEDSKGIQSDNSQTETLKGESTGTDPVGTTGKTPIENGTGVVAKSNNVVSGQDNGKVMSELDKELDALFSSINKLEDVQDADLKNEGTVK